MASVHGETQSEGDDISPMEEAPLLQSTPSKEDEYLRGASPKDKPMSESIKKIFTQRTFVYWFIFKSLYYTQVFAAGLFIPLYAAEWFGGCLDPDGIEVISSCSPDYSTYAYYATLFSSIAGLITFLVSSFTGHLSDKYGRKIFFYVAVITWMIPRCVMIFYINFYLYFGLGLLQAVNGGDFFIASKGYLADIIPNKEERIIGYGFGQSAVGIGCILGSILAVAISTVWNDHTVFMALSVFYILLLIYIRFLIAEPEQYSNPEFAANRSTFIRGATNPFKYLGKVCKYNLIFYLAFLSLLMAIAEAGVMSCLFAYIGNEFKLNHQGIFIYLYLVYIQYIYNIYRCFDHDLWHLCCVNVNRCDYDRILFGAF